MTMHKYEMAVALMKEYPSLQDFVGAQSNWLIARAENVLGVTLPVTYRQFLLEYGAGNFGGTEIYGIVGEDFGRAAIPNGVWYTLDARRTYGLPPNLVVIYNDGCGFDFAIDTSSHETTHCPIVAYPMIINGEKQNIQVIAEDFGEFFLDLVNREIDYYRTRK